MRGLNLVLVLGVACGGDGSGDGDEGASSSGAGQMTGSGTDSTGPSMDEGSTGRGTGEGSEGGSSEGVDETAGADESTGGGGGTTGGGPPPVDPSRGCRAKTTFTPGETAAMEMTFDDVERTFRVRLPAGYDGAPAPVVFALHGGFGSGEQIEIAQAELNPVAEEAGAILIYPDGVATFPRQPPGPLQARAWNAGECCGGSAQNDVDDTGFLMAVLDLVEAEACVDRNRVYSTGMSNGAMMSYRLACEAADRIAAIAPVAAGRVLEPCEPSRQVPLLHIHGDMDLNAPFEGGMGCGAADIEMPSIPETLEDWSSRNGCSEQTAPGFAQGNGECVEYGDCDRETVLCTIVGGNHSWPGGVPMAGVLPDCEGPGTQSDSFIASPTIWAFFAANPRDL